MGSDLSPLVVTLWVLNVLVDSGGQLAFKAAASEPGDRDGMERWRFMLARPWLWVGIACYVAEFLVWLEYPGTATADVEMLLEQALLSPLPNADHGQAPERGFDGEG